MARTLILCPTHDHADALMMSIASVRAQNETDWRMVVICDGAPARTVEILQAIEADDPRIEHRVFPKGERYGEAYRDLVLREAAEEFVCHLSDDDLWRSGHLAAMHRLLAEADWGRQGVAWLPAAAEDLRWRFANVGGAVARRAGVAMRPIAPGINNVAYRREAYMALPEGWTAAPAPGPSDLFMWAKFFRAEGMRIASCAEATVLRMPSRGKRAELTPTERAVALGPWLACLNDPATATLRLDKADVLRGLVTLFAYSEIEGVGKFEAAMEHCGLRMVDPGEPCNVAVDGAMLDVPLSRKQRRQGRCAFLAVKAASVEDEGPTARWKEFAADNPKLARRALRDLAGLAPPFPERAQRLGAG
ncbi:glycosyltransferase family A protein [Acuticoccus sp. I52.16.1]|uniref:glycosyltransferase family 2 protein n=1 Tax=Acuticoccus sp. I52.16.1 TaxID=2928472 RepID=UPI001FD394D3|nr:glycosyltransferase family A protein [Acuticoccus sp. I52.16.1]UOM34275.1 glycosyltransferase family 2 protein [Acuticoccus sp. I52.16.1]